MEHQPRLIRPQVSQKGLQQLALGMALHRATLDGVMSGFLVSPAGFNIA
jgi:hypothetical protein